ncbi:MAG: hypothetical protein LBS25_06250 [Candidatus Symbiothrix sp.]|jgi:hypothetical protein|nr:hypothetical protein [Candidatus Symbiothrix sp.]
MIRKTTFGNTKLYGIITLLFLLFIQEPKAYNLKQIANNDNLSNSSITCLCQDEKGLMMIGTCDGWNI